MQLEFNKLGMSGYLGIKPSAVRARLGGLEVYAGIKMSTLVTGVNSLILSGEHKGEHILMWDFDDSPITLVAQTLRSLQALFDLPEINIVATGRPNSYHAYCFKACPWTKALNMVWMTQGVCKTFVKMAFMREYFTLRFSAKSGREIVPTIRLGSSVPGDVEPENVHSSFVKYRTKAG